MARRAPSPQRAWKVLLFRQGEQYGTLGPYIGETAQTDARSDVAVMQQDGPGDVEFQVIETEWDPATEARMTAAHQMGQLTRNRHPYAPPPPPHPSDAAPGDSAAVRSAKTAVRKAQRIYDKKSDRAYTLSRSDASQSAKWKASEASGEAWERLSSAQDRLQAVLGTTGKAHELERNPERKPLVSFLFSAEAFDWIDRNRGKIDGEYIEKNIFTGMYEVYGDFVKPRKRERNPLPSEEPGGKLVYDADFRAGYQAGQKALSRNRNLTVTDAEKRYRRVSNQYGSWWIDGFTTAIEVDRGNLEVKNVNVAVRLGLVHGDFLRNPPPPALEEYRLQIEGRGASGLAEKLKAGIQTSADICKITPPVCTENLGIPRSDMPQFTDEVADAFVDSMARRGHNVYSEPIPVGLLKATQREINAQRTLGMLDSYRAGTFEKITNAVIVSNDNYILDGHHRWAALLVLDPYIKMEVHQIDVPICNLLTAANAFPGVTQRGIDEPAGPRVNPGSVEIHDVDW